MLYPDAEPTMYSSYNCFGTLGPGLQRQTDSPDGDQKTVRVPNLNCHLGGECCATAILSAREDFKSTCPQLQDVEEAGHTLISTQSSTLNSTR